ncbi:MAG TPA: rRNA maturation RNase YbeY [Chitinophagaceae bacterium]|jgi:rRNA maturation RNase YbeY|nr:rRNA maturation RNase YbeY [Chitinophagaceae bacterium]
MAVFFYFHEINIPLANRRRLKRFISSLFKTEGCKLQQLDYVFCSDEFLLKINREFLHHDTYTDIITFDMTEPERDVSAEIYISAERVKENAEKFGAAFDYELHRVIFHGALHLCGYHDKSPKEMDQMRAKENENLQRYFNPDNEQ